MNEGFTMDVLQRLRVRNCPYGAIELMDKAADEIERLRAAGRALISSIEDHTAHGWDKHPTGCAMCKAVRVALLAFAVEQKADGK